MSLVKEDGSIVSGANTYADKTDLTTYASARGISIPGTDAAKEKLLVLAMDAVESLETTFLGMRVDGDQELSWPRTDPCNEDGSITLGNGQSAPSDEIPKQLLAAQCQLACDLQTNSYFAVSDGKFVVEETVGPLTTRYAAGDQGGGDGSVVNFQKFEALLSVLQKAGGFALTTVRV